MPASKGQVSTAHPFRLLRLKAWEGDTFMAAKNRRGEAHDKCQSVRARSPRRILSDPCAREGEGVGG
eukprot:1158860-Pelagomonas_calceolata.AAC.6